MLNTEHFYIFRLLFCPCYFIHIKPIRRLCWSHDFCVGFVLPIRCMHMNNVTHFLVHSQRNEFGKCIKCTSKTEWTFADWEEIHRMKIWPKTNDGFKNGKRQKVSPTTANVTGHIFFVWFHQTYTIFVRQNVTTIFC